MRMAQMNKKFVLKIYCRCKIPNGGFFIQCTNQRKFKKRYWLR